MHVLYWRNLTKNPSQNMGGVNKGFLISPWLFNLFMNGIRHEIRLSVLEQKCA